MNEEYQAREPDWVFRHMRAGPQLSTLSVDFIKMGAGVTLTGTPIIVAQTVGEVPDAAAQTRVISGPLVGTVTNANCALQARIGNLVQGAIYELLWSCARSDGDVAVALTRVTAI